MATRGASGVLATVLKQTAWRVAKPILEGTLKGAVSLVAANEKNAAYVKKARVRAFDLQVGPVENLLLGLSVVHPSSLYSKENEIRSMGDLRIALLSQAQMFTATPARLYHEKVVAGTSKKGS